MGNLQGDGILNIFDALEIVRYIVGLENTIEHGKKNADGEWIITPEEATRIGILSTQGKAAGEPSIFCALEIVRFTIGADSVVDGKSIAIKPD
jgi:hypothetical protein